MNVTPLFSPQQLDGQEFVRRGRLRARTPQVPFHSTDCGVVVDAAIEAFTWATPYRTDQLQGVGHFLVRETFATFDGTLTEGVSHRRVLAAMPVDVQDQPLIGYVPFELRIAYYQGGTMPGTLGQTTHSPALIDADIQSGLLRFTR
jgi:hypothetical protein